MPRMNDYQTFTLGLVDELVWVFSVFGQLISLSLNMSKKRKSSHAFASTKKAPQRKKLGGKSFKNIKSTPDNSKLALTQTKMDFPIFPLDFRQTFTVILPSASRTLDNSNLPLTPSNFRFPSDHFMYNFTLDNSNHVCQTVYCTGPKH